MFLSSDRFSELWRSRGERRGSRALGPLQVAFGPLALTAQGREQLGREISPINYVTDKLPPTLIIHGDHDEVVPLQQSESFVAKARRPAPPTSS